MENQINLQAQIHLSIYMLVIFDCSLGFWVIFLLLLFCFVTAANISLASYSSVTVYFHTTGICCKYPGSCEKLCSSLCKFWAAIHFFVCTFRCWSCTGTGNLSSVNFVQSPGFCFTFIFRPLWRYLLLFCVIN